MCVEGRRGVWLVEVGSQIMWDCAIWNLVLHDSTQTEEALCSLIAAESVKSAVTENDMEKLKVTPVLLK